jgi:hypothetical protein
VRNTFIFVLTLAPDLSCALFICPTLCWCNCPSHVEAGSDISTVGVVGGDEKETQCLGIKLGHPVPGGYKYGDLALQVGGSMEHEAVKYGHESQGTRT